MDKQRIVTALTAACSLLLVHCGDDDDRGSDTIMVVDMGPRDAGVTVCEGTMAPCSTHSPSVCDSIPGCRAGSCTGRADSCVTYDYQSECFAGGCDWNYDFDWCEGSAPRCDYWGERSRCEATGCDWVLGDTCTGTPPSCGSLSVAECRSTDGCNVIGEAPADAGPPDAGTVDGGMDGGSAGSCPGGECDLATGGGCPAGQGCYFGSDGLGVCATAGSGIVGATCVAQAQCAPGLICLGDADSGYCLQICCGGDATICGAGSSCGGITGVDGIGGCTLPCDLYDQTGCGAGAACYSTSDGPVCGSAGTGTEGDPCTVLNDCAPGFGCVEGASGFECVEYCNPASPSCTNPALTCQRLSSGAGACAE